MCARQRTGMCPRARRGAGVLKEVQAGARAAVRIAEQQARQDSDAALEAALEPSQIRRRKIGETFCRGRPRRPGTV